MSPQAGPDLLDQYGPLLNAREMARIFGITVNAFYKNARLGTYALFEVTPACGPRRYSKQLLTRYLAGEDVRLTSGSFRRSRSA